MKRLILALMFGLSSVPSCVAADAISIAGKWQFALDMSHGKRTGTLHVQQDGEKLSGTGELEKHGASTLSGSVQGERVSIKIQLHGGAFTLLGRVEGDKMSGTTDPAGGTWKATKQTE
jgi:hypothetical protein